MFLTEKSIYFKTSSEDIGSWLDKAISAWLGNAGYKDIL